MLKSYNFLKYNKVIGILHYDTETKQFSFSKLSKLKQDYPVAFFFNTPFDEEVDLDVLYNYLEERVCDKHNQRINDLLDYMDLVEWDLYEILKFNMGRTMSDMFWIDFDKEV